MQGLRNMGPKIRQWRKDWEIRKLMAKHAKLDIALPSGGMTPIGYVAIEFSIMKQKACESCTTFTRCRRRPAASRLASFVLASDHERRLLPSSNWRMDRMNLLRSIRCLFAGRCAEE